MPLYEYRCQKCAHTYEKREGFDAPARQKCPKCRGKALRVLHAPPIVFKGSGFYVTDNRKNGASDASESAPSSEKSSDGSSSVPSSEKSNSDSSSSSSDKDAKPSAGADSSSTKATAK